MTRRLRDILTADTATPLCAAAAAAASAASAALLLLAVAASAALAQPAHTVNAHTTDARGWAGGTRAGSGGRILRVTTLAPSGPGSLRAALEAEGARTVVFEVGGVIDMAGEPLAIKNGFITVAGQTAPSPGITVIKAETTIHAPEVLIQHLRFRPGEFGRPKKGGGDQDGVSTVGAVHHVIVDHCSFSWATDENLSASGPRFTGATPADWRAGTSQRITYSHNLIYESLSNSVHEKGEHSKGSLIHDNTSGVLIWRNVYASNRERNPLFKGGAQGAVVNNIVFNPGARAIHYNLHAGEWVGKAHLTGRMSVIGNVLRHGPDTEAGTPLFTLRGEGDVELLMADNLAWDRDGQPVPLAGDLSRGKATLLPLTAAQAALPADIQPMPAAALERALPAAVGARPWDRDAIDALLLREMAAGRGRIIDSEAQHPLGYPQHAPTRRAFVEADWNLADMSPRAGWADIVRLTRPRP